MGKVVSIPEADWKERRSKPAKQWPNKPREDDDCLLSLHVFTGTWPSAAYTCTCYNCVEARRLISLATQKKARRGASK